MRKIIKFFNEKNEFTQKLRQEIDSKSNSLFEKVLTLK